jgi:hypothetical protein
MRIGYPLAVIALAAAPLLAQEPAKPANAMTF